MELIGKEVLDFRIKHRFSELTHEASQLFGLDQASMRITFDYDIAEKYKHRVWPLYP